MEDQLGVVAQGFFRDFLKTFSLHPEPASPTRTELETGLESQLTQAVPHYATVVRLGRLSPKRGRPLGSRPG